jgi:stage III sporulation protein AA
MASGFSPWRVAVIDTRGELSFSLSGEGLCLDVLSGYPRGIGIEIATRTMNAQLIVCDEIGDTREAEAIMAAQNCGVPFLATAHADSIRELLKRTGIAKLHEARVFGCYVGIKRRGSDFNYTFTEWEDADIALQSCGSCGDISLRN